MSREAAYIVHALHSVIMIEIYSYLKVVYDHVFGMLRNYLKFVFVDICKC